MHISQINLNALSKKFLLNHLAIFKFFLSADKHECAFKKILLKPFGYFENFLKFILNDFQ